MTRDEFDNLLIELSSVHNNWDTRFKLLAEFDEMKARAERAEARLAELEKSYTIQPSETTNWSAEDIIRREGG
jgi:phosphatidate phosphatase APP1